MVLRIISHSKVTFLFNSENYASLRNVNQDYFMFKLFLIM